MKWKDFTNWIGSSALDHESEVNVDEIWSQLEPRVDAMNNRSGLSRKLVTIIALVLLTAGGIGGYYAYTTMVQPSGASASATTIGEEDLPDFSGGLKENHASFDERDEIQLSEAGDEDKNGKTSINHGYRYLNSKPSSLAEDNSASDKMDDAQTFNQFSSTVAPMNEETSGEGEGETSAVLQPSALQAPEPSSDDLSAPSAFQQESLSRHDLTLSDDRTETEDSMVPTVAGPDDQEEDGHSPGEAIVASVMDKPAEEEMSASGQEDQTGKEGPAPFDEVADATMPGIPEKQENTAHDGDLSSLDSDVPGNGNMVEEFHGPGDPVGLTPSDLTTEVASEDTVVLAQLSSAGPVKKKKNNRCPNLGTFGGKPWLFMAGAEAGAAFPVRSVRSTTTDSESNALLGYREDRETSLARIQYGLVFSAMHPSGVTLTSGFGFATLLERYDHFETITETELVFGVEAIAVNVYGDTTYIMGEIPRTTTKEVRKQIFNRYSYFEFPVLIGYQREVEQWSFGMFTGAYLGLLTSMRGQISDETGTEVQLADMSDQLYAKKFTLSYYFGGRVAYNFDRGISVFVKPQLRWAPHNTTSADYPVQTKYLFPGVNLGMVYRFSN